MSPVQDPAAPGAASGTLEAPQVAAMFDRIAGVYDLLNSVMTAGLHHKWRARATDLARIGPGTKVLDVATGTGDLAVEIASRGADVIGSDFSEGMLDIARKKAPQLPFEQGDAMALKYETAAFDACTVGFGARNFADLDAGLREMTRVVKPGGRVVILEMTTPTKPPLSLFFSAWFDRVVPLLGRITGGGEAYTYLPNSVKRWPGPHELAAHMDAAGLTNIKYILTAGGIIAMHVGEKPTA